MNREQMGLASASTSSAVPAARHRGPVAALIAAVIVAAALLFAMPSLAFASTEAGGSQQATDSQEILLSQQGSSKSVNKTPDEPKTPPAYTQQDAYKSTPQSTGSGVDSVSGAGDSKTTSYTPGDDKSSINDKDSDSDSDVASDPSISGTKDTDDSTLNEGEGTSDSNKGNDSTADSNGAFSGSTDEIATDINQSAHPTGSDSKADDVIATPGDRESADQNAGTTSDKTEEVYGPPTPVDVQVPTQAAPNSTVETASENITTQAGCSITIHLDYGFSTKPTLTTYESTKVKLGDAQDPIFSNSGSFLFFEGTAGTISKTAAEAVDLGLDRINSSTVYNFRYGYTLTQWMFIVTQGGQQKVASQSSFSGMSTFANYNNGKITAVEAYPILNFQQKSVNYFKSNLDKISGAGGQIKYANKPVYPEDLSTPYNCASGYEWIAQQHNSPNKKATATYKANATLGDILNTIWNFRGSSDAYNSAVYEAVDIYETEIKEDLSFTVVFNAGTGATGGPLTYTYTSKSAVATASGVTGGTLPEASFSYAGHDFKGWSATNGATTATIISAGLLSTAIGTPANGQTYQLYAVWAPKTYTITYSAGSGVTGVTVPSQGTATHGGNYTVSTTSPTRTGYKFDGWTNSAGGSVNAGDTISNVTSNITLTAKWIAQYTISYNGNGGSGTAPTGATVDAGQSHTVQANTFTKANSTFTGWNTAQNGTGTAYAAGATISNINSNITLYAQWQGNPSITFNGNPHSGAGSATVGNMPGNVSSHPYNTAYTLPTTTPTLKGFKFDGWKKDNTGSTLAAGAAAGNITANTTYYAQWSPLTGYTVTFYANATGSSDGTAHNTQASKSWTDAITLPSAPTKTGYNFAGWFLTKDGNGNGLSGQLSGNTTVRDLWTLASNAADTTKSMKLYAKWTEKDRITVTLNLNGATSAYHGQTGSYVFPSQLPGTNTFTIPSDNPVKTGYNFKGWADSASATSGTYSAGNTWTNLTENKTVYAIWSAAPVNFTFLGGDPAAKASGTTTATANYGSKLTTLGNTAYTLSGNNFVNWSYTNSSNNPATANAGAQIDVSSFKISWAGDANAGTLTGTATLTANWSAITYSILWNANEGSSNSTQNNVKAGDNITFPTQPTRKGYSFTGWTTASTGGTAIVAGNPVRNYWTLPANGGQLVAYAQWEEDKVLMKFHVDSNANIQWGNGNALSDGAAVQVGAATGKIYSVAGSTTFPANLSTGIAPVPGTNYEFNASHGAKWTLGSKTGTQVTSGVSNNGLLVPAQSNGLFTAGEYYLTVAPKWYNFTVEYYTQNLTGTGYTKVSNPAGSGSAPFGNTLQAGASAGTSGTTSTYVRQNIAGFTYNAGAAGSKASLTMAATGNTIALYFDRNIHTVNVTYTGDVPPSMTYAPASQTKKFGETVSLIAPTAPSGYTWSGWKQVSGTTTAGVGSGNFSMPDSDVAIEGVWGKQQYYVDFKTNSTYGAALIGQTRYPLDFGDALSALPTANPQDSNAYYFMGWRAYEGCTTAGSESTSTVTPHPLMSPDAILGLGTDAGTPWTVSSHTVFVAEFGQVISIVYTAGAASGAFGSQNGAQTGDTVTQAGTRYSRLQAGWKLPMYGGAMDSDARNAGNPKAAPGYKFIGWEWNDVIQGQTFRALGSYTGTGTSAVFHSTNGVNLPSIIDQSLTFTAIWEETTQQLHFDVNTSNLTGVAGIPATDKTAKTGQGVTLPQAPSYTAAANAAGYDFLGWSTDSGSAYVQGTSPLYTNTYTMTPGARNTTLYTQGDAGYGVTLYPVFREKTATINYVLANGSAGMGTLSKASENVAMVSGNPTGVTATANAGHTFKGWFSDAAHSSIITTDATLTPAKVGGVLASGTYYAYFEIDQFDVIFKVGDHGTWNDGTTADKGPVKINYNAQVGSNVPAYKGNTGYGFHHWVDQDGKTITNLATERITKNMTYTIVWEPRTGYTIEYNTNGATVTIPNQSVQWTTNINTNMPAAAKSLFRQGYTFGGWYATPTFNTGTEVTSSMTFADGIAAAGITVSGDDPATLPLYAKWDARDITIHFVPNHPASAVTMPDVVKTWDDANLLGANERMSASGYNFTKWVTATSAANANASAYQVTNTTKVSDMYKQLFGATDNTHTEITIYGLWGDQSFTVEYKDASGNTVHTVPGLKWTDQLDWYVWAPADGSQRLTGWNYTPAGGTQQTWVQTAGKLPVSAFGGSTTPADGATFTLRAALEANTKYIINYNKVNLATDGSGTPNMVTKNTLDTFNGYVEPNTAIDLTMFNSRNHITGFENQNGAGRRADLTGYAFDAAISKTTSNAGEATVGGTITFDLFWVEKPFTIKYDMGKDAQGNPAPSTIGSISDKLNVGWTAASLIPDTSAVHWDGHKDNPQWQYRDSTGTLRTISATTKVSDIMGASDSNTNPITLYALWETQLARITWAVTTGGTAADGGWTVNSGSRYEDINSVTGTPHTMTAAPSANYKFDGWYKDGTLVSNDPTYTPVKGADGMFATATYEARFVPLGSIPYTVEHMFEGLDGVYVLDSSLASTDTKAGQEFSTVTAAQAAGYAKTVNGFTYTPGLTGSKETITSLVAGEKIILLYKRNEFIVNVDAVGAGDAPAATDYTVNWPATGLTQASTTQKFGQSLTLPTVTAPTGWSFQWSISENGTPRGTMAGGATFTMPNAIVDVIGTWKRTGHNVQFVISPSDNNGDLSVIGGKVLPFTVDHGKSLSDTSASGNATNNIRVTPHTGYSFSGWSYVDPVLGTTTTRDPDSVVINQDTTFTAVFSQTFAVIYHPGTHPGTGFTSMVVNDDIPANTKNVNEFPLVLTPGGADVTMNPPAEVGYRFIGWTWTQGGNDYYVVAPGQTPTAAMIGTPGTMNFMVNEDVNFTAQWAADAFELIFKLDSDTPASTWTPGGVMAGGSGDYHMNPMPTTGSHVTVLGATDVAKEGHQLAGWKIWTDNNNDGLVDATELSSQLILPGASFTMPAHAVTLIPTWNFQTLQIRYQIGNGSVGYGTISDTVENITATTGLRAKGSNAKPNDGYYVVGWYTDPDCTNPVDSTWIQANLDGSKRILPERLSDGAWTAATYYVKFGSDFTTFKIEHYFQGPDGEYTLFKTDGCPHMMTGDVASVLDPANHAYQYLITDPATLKGHKFDDNQIGRQRLMDTVKSDGSTTLKLYYSNVPFKITYVNEDGTEVNWTGRPGYPTAVAETTVNIPGAQLAGHEFAGWTLTWTDEDGVSGMLKTDSSFTMPYANVLATASWKKINDVIIKFFQNDGSGEVDMNADETVTGVGVAGTNFTVPGATITAHRPAGYTFDAANSVVSIELVDGENIARVVYKLLTDYKVIFNANGGQETTTVGGMDLASVIANFQPADLPTKMGYTLGQLDAEKALRWNTAADGSGTWLTIDMTYQQLAEALLGAGFDDQQLLERGLTLYANWIENDFYKVIYDLNNDKNVNTGLLKPVPDHRNPFTPDPIDGVKWTQDGFNLYSDEELDAAPNGYEFAGWNTARDGSGLTITDLTKYLDMSNAIDRNVEQASITLYAMWKELVIEIEYVVNDENGGSIDRVLDRVSAVTGQHVDEGSSAGNRLHSVATAKPGYHFVRWEYVPVTRTIGIDENDYDMIRDDKSEILVVEPDENGRLVAARYMAIFEKNPDAVIDYDLNGGTYFVNGNEMDMPKTTISHGLTTDLHKGTGVKLPHYTLVGWNTEPDGSGTTYKLGQKVTMPEEGMTLYAQWQVKSYNVHVSDRGDDVADVYGGDTKVTYGDPLDPEWISTISQTPKEGSTFKGWKYTMTDAETGEVYEGTVWDLSELPEIVGPVEIEALYDTVPVEVPEEDVVTEGTYLPKTGDDGMLMIVAIILAALALIALGIRLLVVLFARRRNSDDPENDPHGTRAGAGFGRGQGRAHGTAAVNNSASAAAFSAKAACSFFGHPLTYRNCWDAHTNAGARSLSLGHEATPTLSMACAPAVLSTKGAVSCASDLMNSRSRNGRFACGATTEVATACGAQTRTPGLFLSLGKYADGCSRVSLATRSIRIGIASVIAACALVFAVAFAPGIALASTGDPGADANTTTSIQTRSNHSNADPAIHQTGSSNVKGTTSASASTAKHVASTASSTKTASSGSTSTKSTPRASADFSAASAQAASSGAARPSTVKAAEYELQRITLKNKLIHKSDDKLPGHLSSSSATSTVRSSSAAVSAKKISGAATVGTVRATGSASLSGATGATGVAGTAGSLAAAAQAGSSGSAGTYASYVAAPDAVGTFSYALLPDTSAPGSADIAANAASLSSGASGNRVAFANTSLGGAIAPVRSQLGAITPLNSTNGKFSTLLTTNNAAIVPSRGTSESSDPDSDSDSDAPPEAGVVKITYTAGEGGMVSGKQDLICAITGTQPDVDGLPTDQELIGAIATPALGYHFVGWTVEGCPTCLVDELCCDKEKLDAKTVKELSYSKDSSLFTALKFTSVFERNTYALDYDLNGGLTSGSAGAAKGPAATTYGNDDVMANASQPTREGYTFLCWNTSADGMGAPVRDGETLTTGTIRSLVRTSIGRESDADGSTIKLFARWTPNEVPVVVDPSTPDPEPTTPDEPVTPVRPAVPSTPASPSVPTTVPAGNTHAGPARVQAVASPVAYSPASVAADSAVAEPADLPALIADAQNALSLPPALDVLPAAAEGFATISAEALSGLQEGEDAVGMSSADATRAAATVAAAAGAIAIALGAAGAVSQIAARRRAR